MEFPLYPKDDDTLEQTRADAQALADMRALDDWARSEHGRQVWLRNFHDGGVGLHPGWSLQLVEELRPGQHFTGATPDEARAKAAAWVRERTRLPRYHHCDQCDSDHDVTLVEYDAMVDGPGYSIQEWLCQECRG